MEHPDTAMQTEKHTEGKTMTNAKERIFTVEGRGEFPLDMLRRDAASAYTTADQAKISATFGSGQTGLRRVTLVTKERWVTEGRWESFGWTVIDTGSDSFTHEIVITVTGPNFDPSVKAKAKSLNPWHDMSGGTLMKAVKDLVAKDKSLKGKEPELSSAICAHYALVAWKMMENDGVVSLSHKALWMDGRFIQIQFN